MVKSRVKNRYIDRVMRLESTLLKHINVVRTFAQQGVDFRGRSDEKSKP